MAKNKKKSDDRKLIASNRRAKAKFEIVETCEAGIVLTGPEVKSLRQARVNLQEGFGKIDNEQAYLWNVHISPYAQGSLHVQQEPLRTRKLLLNKREIMKWMGKMTAKSLTLVPLDIYFNKRGVAKVTLALARSKKAPDRRDDIQRRDVERHVRREFGGKHRIR